MHRDIRKIVAVGFALAVTLAASQVYADADFFGGFIKIDSTWFQLQNPGGTQITAFDGASLGSFVEGNVANITDGAGLTFKNGGSDVSGVDFNWRVWSGAPSGSFTSVGLPFGADATFTDPAGNSYTNGGDQRWGGNGSGVTAQNFLNGLTPGTYTLEIFLHANTNVGDRYLNDAANGFDNYTATFTVAAIPEPTTFGLVGVGLLGAWFIRRRTV